MFRRPIIHVLLIVLAVSLQSVLDCNASTAHAQGAASRYAVDGLALGGLVRQNSSVYKQYDCRDSDQFKGYRFCQRKKLENRSGTNLSITTTIIHDQNGRVAYVNQFVAPTESTDQSVDAEIERLSAKMGEKPQVRRTPDNENIPKGVMAIWGNLSLQELSGFDLDVVRNGKSPNRGILADYLADFAGSAEKHLPVYTIPSGQGFVWIANYGSNDVGTLRFFAIDADALSRARAQPAVASAETPQNRVLAEDNRREARRKQELAELKPLLDKCGASCPDNPEADLARREVIDLIEHDKMVASEAAEFAGALNDTDAVRKYLSTCQVCAFRKEANEAIDRLNVSTGSQAASESENTEYQNAGDDLALLKKYVADCVACTHIQDAADKIKQLENSAADDFPEVTVCNNDHLAVYVASVGRPSLGIQAWIAGGWKKVEAGDCSAIGRFAKGHVMLTAFNHHGAWPSKDNTDVSYCGSYSLFYRAIIDNDECTDGEKLFGYTRIDLDASGYTWTLNPIPWSYAAVAYSPNSNSWGFATGRSSSDEASNAALGYCSQNASDCTLGTWARDDLCLALAQGQGGGLGWASGSTSAEAHNRAIEQCREAGNRSCAVVNNSCD